MLWSGILEPYSVMGWGSGVFLLVSVVRSVQKARAPQCCPSEQFTPFFHFLLCLGAPQGLVAPARYSGAVREHSVAAVSRVGSSGLGIREHSVVAVSRVGSRALWS